MAKQPTADQNLVQDLVQAGGPLIETVLQKLVEKLKARKAEKPPEGAAGATAAKGYSSDVLSRIIDQHVVELADLVYLRSVLNEDEEWNTGATAQKK